MCGKEVNGKACRSAAASAASKPPTTKPMIKNGKMLIFWEDRVSSQTWQTVVNLKENQLITVSGEIWGRDDGLLTVKELEEEVDDEGDVFI